MRNLILRNLQRIKDKGGFNPEFWRWEDFFINGIPVIDCKFEDLNDEELLNAYDRIMRKFWEERN